MYFDPASVVTVAFVLAEKAATMTMAERVAIKILVQLFIGRTSFSSSYDILYKYKRFKNGNFLTSARIWRIFSESSMTREHSPQAEFESLLIRFSASIKGSILKLGLEKKGIDPEDVIQEVRIKIWKKFKSEKKSLWHPSYIYRVVDSTLIDCIRKARVQDGLIQHRIREMLQENDPPSGSSARDSRLWDKLAGAADSLPGPRRQVVKLFMLNLSIEEISLCLHWSLNRTRNLLYRGLNDLRKMLNDKGVCNGDG
jgi:RNA polymerase sigma factor (sigma-70 family)